MTREIKFKRYYDDGEPARILSIDEIKDEVKDDEWVPYAHQVEFTGLLDKNGKEIFEGDVVEVFNRGKWVVDFIGGAFQMRKLSKTKHQWLSIATYSNVVEADGTVSSVEIVSNVYESPELLQDNK